MQHRIRLLHYIFAPLCIFFTSMMIVKTISYFFVQTKSAENIFYTSEWVPAKTTVILKHQTMQNKMQEYTNEEKITSYSDQNSEHFQLTIDGEKNQFLSFQYKLDTEETAEKFDVPAVIVFANQTPILQLAPTQYDNKWHEAFIDLHKSGLNPGVYDLLFISQNTYDDQFSPTFSVREVTTTKFFSNTNSFLQFTTDKEVDSVEVEYTLWQNEQKVVVKNELKMQTKSSSETNSTSPSYLFSIPENLFGAEIAFWSTDLFGNVEESQYLNVQHSHSLNVTEFESQLFTESEHELFVQTQFQNTNETPKFIDARISQHQIDSEEKWNQATSLEQKQFQQFIKVGIPSSYSVGTIQSNLVFQNLPEGQRYISLKLCTEALSCEYLLQNQLITSN